MQLLNGNFILTITRILENSSPLVGATTRNLKIKRKLGIPEKSLSIYRFDSFDNFCEFCTYISNILADVIVNKIKNSALYVYDSNYYLVLKNTKLTEAEFRVFCSAITEFATLENKSSIFEYKLKEYGRIVIKSNAVATTLKYFK